MSTSLPRTGRTAAMLGASAAGLLTLTACGGLALPEDPLTREEMDELLLSADEFPVETPDEDTYSGGNMVHESYLGSVSHTFDGDCADALAEVEDQDDHWDEHRDHQVAGADRAAWSVSISSRSDSESDTAAMWDDVTSSCDGETVDVEGTDLTLSAFEAGEFTGIELEGGGMTIYLASLDHGYNATWVGATSSDGETVTDLAEAQLEKLQED